MNLESTKIVYSLICPIKKEIKYIGITNNTETRLKSHLTCKNNKAKYKWIQTLKEFNKEPILKIIKKCNTVKEAEDLEQKLIETHKGLLNKKNHKNYTVKSIYIYDIEKYNTFKKIIKNKGTSMSLEINNFINNFINENKQQ
mgnify:CR=1 FL=1|tara:strand:- start:438 stop:863 length:426 start_codon:yes stop_codon:yes gene_type:complete